MADISLGKLYYLLRTPDIAMVSNPTTIYQRKDGTCYCRFDGKKMELKKETNHTKYYEVNYVMDYVAEH